MVLQPDFCCPEMCLTDRLPHYRTVVLYNESYTKRGALRHMRARDLGRDPRLTKEQEAMRLRGLRILARMIVRAHLRSLIEQDARMDASVPDEGISRKEADRAG